MPKINYFRLCIVCNEQVKRYFTQIGSDLFDKAIVDESAKNNMKKPLGFTFNIKSFKKSFRQNLGQIFDSKNLKFRRKFTSWHLPISLSLSLSLSLSSPYPIFAMLLNVVAVVAQTTCYNWIR